MRFSAFLFLLGTLLSAFLGTVSCANPKYVAPTPEAQGRDQRLLADNCAAKFISGACVSYTWEKMPTETEFGAMVFKTFRPNLADGSPVPEDLPGTPAVVLWMPAMGHGSSPVTVERVDIGTYRASQVFFTMRGAWEIHFQMKDRNAVKDQAIVPLTF